MDKSRPKAREKHVTTGGSGVHRRGEGQGGGPVGSGNGPGFPGGSGSGSGGGGKRSGGGLSLPGIIVLLIIILGGGGGLGSSLLGGLSGSDSGSGSGSGSDSNSQSYYNMISSQDSSPGSSGGSGWTDDSSNVGKLNKEVAKEARERYTTIQGDGSDVVTLMVYMCGTDLESRSGMATNDISEMAAASLGKNVNLILYTGGCKRWRNQVVSNKNNQIYQVTGGGLKLLNKNMGNGSMTDPATLTEFIKYCSKNFPANRNELIFWDHGGGSLTGYGYDEKHPGSGSMTLAGIDTALKNANMKFDFIGFDTCLMATVENAQMLSKYGDYMIASEETEPGVGWYYTNWLNNLAADTSRPTLDIGKDIIDDFVTVCNKKCRGQQTTLSIVDLAEFQETVPSAFTAFAKDTRTKIQKKDYKIVSTARGKTREFSPSSGIDQIDLIHFALNMGTKEGKALASSLKKAIKYNRTSANMTNAYGISAYFPYKRTSNVDKAVKTYHAIGMDDEYSQCIREFASMEVGGQLASGGTGSPLISLFGNLESGSSSQSSADIAQLLNAFLGNQSGITGLSGSNSDFFTGKSLDLNDMADYIAENQFDTKNILWKNNSSGQQVISMPEDQWDLITKLDYNMFYDDGEGYVDLGLDNVYEFDEEGNLIGPSDRTWISINGQPVAYYHLDTTEDGNNYTITGKVPAKLNGERVDLILVFDQDNPKGYVAGARPDYDEDETETESRGLIDLKKGDKLDFLCDYYDYKGNYQDSYMLGQQLLVPGSMDQLVISNTDVGDGPVISMYRFTDIYHQNYWTERIVQ